VTRDLPGSEVEPPQWGEWLRLVGARARTGSTVMTGPGDRPLLMLAREQKGRVALFLSDHAWLWARGFRDGGPHLDLLRRLGHWLMKEPDLEEEALRAARAAAISRSSARRWATTRPPSWSPAPTASPAPSRSSPAAPACSRPGSRPASSGCTGSPATTSPPSPASAPRTRAN
jgi:hypothetical protein